MKTLLIFRHAKSDWGDASLADHDRPLNKRGREDAPRMGALLRQESLNPDLVLCSTAKRARKTAELALEEAGYASEIRFLEDFYAAPPQVYFKALAQLPDPVDLVMVVGHNPGLEELLARLTGELQALPTAALAQVELPIDRWDQLNPQTRGKLVELWKPKELS
jgi:phosphohistidine phosphatase